MLHSSRVEWLACSRSKKMEILEQMASVDSDAVVKMKTAVRHAAGKGILDEDDVKEFYEYCGYWFDEFVGKGNAELSVHEKIAIVRFANSVKP